MKKLIFTLSALVALTSITFFFFFKEKALLAGILITAEIILPFLFLLLCYFFLAERNIFFTFPKENRIMYVMYGKHFTGRIIYSLTDYFVDKDFNIKPKIGNTPPLQKNKKIWGMEKVGLWPFYTIYERPQQWQQQKLDKEKNELVVITRDEMTPFLIVTPFEYAMILKAAEDSGGIPMDMTFTPIVRPVHSIKPVFGVHDSYSQLQTIILGEALSFVKSQKFETIGDEKIDHGQLRDEFSNRILALNDYIPGRQDGKGLREVLGYEITSVKIYLIVIVGDNRKRILEATTLKYEAQQKAQAQIEESTGKAKAKLIESEAGKQAMIMKSEGEALAIEKLTQAKESLYKIVKDNPVAGTIETVKELQGTQLTTLVIGKDTMLNIGVDKKST